MAAALGVGWCLQTLPASAGPRSSPGPARCRALGWSQSGVSLESVTAAASSESSRDVMCGWSARSGGAAWRGVARVIAALCPTFRPVQCSELAAQAARHAPPRQAPRPTTRLSRCDPAGVAVRGTALRAVGREGGSADVTHTPIKIPASQQPHATPWPSAGL